MKKLAISTSTSKAPAFDVQLQIKRVHSTTSDTILKLRRKKHTVRESRKVRFSADAKRNIRRHIAPFCGYKHQTSKSMFPFRDIANILRLRLSEKSSYGNVETNPKTTVDKKCDWS